MFAFAGPLTVEVRLRAEQAGTFPFCLVLTIYRRSDGLCVTQQIGRQATLLAYVDVFRYTAIATAVLVPLALLLRSPKPSPPEK